MNELEAQAVLDMVIGRGFFGSYVELVGGGDLAVTVKVPIGSAIVSYMGVTLYPEEWDGEDVPMYNFDDTLEALDMLDVAKGIEWLDKLVFVA
jgi:hypothetical protein